MNWFQQLRLRVLVVVVGCVLALFALLSWVAWPVPAIVGVAVLTVAALVNTMTSRLSGVTCLGCGEDLAGQPSHAYGMVCPKCGTLTLPVLEDKLLASAETDEDSKA